MNVRAGGPPWLPWCPRASAAKAPGQVLKPKYPCCPARLPGVPAPSCAAGSWTISSCARPPYWLPLRAAHRHQPPLRTRTAACVMASCHATHVAPPRALLTPPPSPPPGSSRFRASPDVRASQERSPHGGARGKDTAAHAGLRAT